MSVRKMVPVVLALFAIAFGNSPVSAQKTANETQKDIVTTAVEAGSFTTLAAALKAGGLVGALQGEGPFTVFAPTDEAFAKLPAETIEMLLKKENKDKLVAILTYHVVSGKVDAASVVELNAAATLNGQRVGIATEDGAVMINGAKVVKADIGCSNGIIHVIDTVLMPSSDNIPTTASKAGTFKTLLAAAKAAGLVDALSGEGPLTVFAPTDEAFAALPQGTVASLLKPENKDQLAAILKFHVVAGRVYSGDVLAGAKLESLQGGMLNASVKGDVAMINGAKIVATDIDASNGVIHVIGSVMLPPADNDAHGNDGVTPVTYRTQVCPATGNVTYIKVQPGCGK